jgi:hypothetical protein
MRGPNFTVDTGRRMRLMRFPAHAIGGLRGPAFASRTGVLRMVALALPLLLAAACNFLPPIEEPMPEGRIVTATGMGQAPAERETAAMPPPEITLPAPPTPKDSQPPESQPVVRRPGTDSPAWASETLEVEASAPFPSGANSHVQALMLARRQANDQVLRDLASRVGDLTSPRGGTVGSVLAERADLRAEVERTLRAEVEFTSGEESASGYRTTARLPLRSIALIVFGEVEEAKTTGPSAPANVSRKTVEDDRRSKANAVRTESRRIAREKAEEQARARLFEKIRQTPLTANYPVGARIQRDPFLAAYVRGAVENARVDKVSYPDDRTCEVTLSMDVQPLLRRLLEPSR